MSKIDGLQFGTIDIARNSWARQTLSGLARIPDLRIFKRGYILV